MRITLTLLLAAPLAAQMSIAPPRVDIAAEDAAALHRLVEAEFAEQADANEDGEVTADEAEAWIAAHFGRGWRRDIGDFVERANRNYPDESRTELEQARDALEQAERAYRELLRGRLSDGNGRAR